jgi:hypothetical protein
MENASAEAAVAIRWWNLTQSPDQLELAFCSNCAVFYSSAASG